MHFIIMVKHVYLILYKYDNKQCLAIPIPEQDAGCVCPFFAVKGTQTVWMGLQLR